MCDQAEGPGHPGLEESLSSGRQCVPQPERGPQAAHPVQGAEPKNVKLSTGSMYRSCIFQMEVSWAERQLTANPKPGLGFQKPDPLALVAL